MGNVLGRHEILEELGRGAMGVVYKARDPVLNRIVAIKTMSAESAEDEELRNRLTREANAAAKLKHPNIITVHDYGEDNGIPFIALEFLDGIDLRQIIRNRIFLYPSEKLGILKQVALGLGHAHKAGVVHRDVKPGNIRILRDGTVKIMDFGIARIASSQLTRIGTVLGSVDYMSPEQVEGRQVDHRCDQFGFGVVAYELLGERLPFRGNSMPATMNNILQKDPPPLPEKAFSPFPTMKELIQRCLEKVPTSRFENFQEVARELDSIAQGMTPDDATTMDFRGASPSGIPPDQETVVIADVGQTVAADSEDWQGGEHTVSSVQLWVARDRFQKISASLEKVEKEKPKRPVRLGTVRQRQVTRSAPTTDAPSIASTSRTRPPSPTRRRVLNASMKVGLTGTPIENRVEDLKALFDLVLPGYLGSDEDFARTYGNNGGASETRLKALRKITSPFVLRRLKEAVLDELPEKIEDIRTCRLSEDQVKLYRDAIEARGARLVERLHNEGERLPYIHVFALLALLKRICDHPALVLDKGREKDSVEKYASGKWELFQELLFESLDSGQKVVVFTQFLGMIEMMECLLSCLDVGFATLTGASRRRGEIIRRFNEEAECCVFLGSLKAGGTGIDLMAGSVVIHYDRWWNAAREDQATDRVHRIGQKKAVQVFKLVTEGTLEEKISAIIDRKRKLMNAVVQTDDPHLTKLFTREELIDLLQPLSDSPVPRHSG